MMSPFALSTFKTFRCSSLLQGFPPLGKLMRCCCCDSCAALGAGLCTCLVSKRPIYGSIYFRRLTLQSFLAKGLI